MSDTPPVMDFTARIGTEGSSDVSVEHSGRRISTVLFPEQPGDRELFVQLHSWEEIADGPHAQMRALLGKRVRVRIEVVE